MNLEKLIGQIVRVKDPRVVGRKHSALLLAVSHDGLTGYLRLTKTRSKIQAQGHDILPTTYGHELARRKVC